MANCDALQPAHVMLMLRRRFFGQPWWRNYESRSRRQAAIVGMHALAGAGPSELNRFELDHFDAERKTVLLTFVNAPRLVPVTPALDYLLNDWLEVRKGLVGRDGSCTNMFVGEHGEPQNPASINAMLHNVGVSMGTRKPLSAMLLAFFQARIALGSDLEAYRYLIGTSPNWVKDSTATMRSVRELIAETDPIGDDLRILTDESFAAEFARTSKEPFPLSLAGLSGRKARALDPAHSLAVKLAAELEARPEEAGARAAHDARVIAENLVELEHPIRAKQLSISGAAKMLGMTDAEFKAKRNEALTTVGVSPERHHKRLPMTAEELARLAGIEAERWPDDLAAHMPFRIDLLRREFGFVHAMIRARKLTRTRACELFKASYRQLKLLMAAADAQKLDELLANPSGDMWTRSTSRYAPMTAEQRARLARIAAETWPDDASACVAFRIDLLKREFPFVRGLLLGRLLSRRPARALFKASLGQMNALMDAAAEGRLEQLLADPTCRLSLKSYATRSPVTAEQRTRVERIAAERWPEDSSDWPAFRIELVKREFPFIGGLITTGHLHQNHGRQLFKASLIQIERLMAAARGGQLEQMFAAGLKGRMWMTYDPHTRPGEFVWPAHLLAAPVGVRPLPACKSLESHAPTFSRRCEC
ncbi:hypothetical protein QU42_19470 [Bradyrhizobium sp. UASWS1016]|nr:hypothetical protein QU42_19470 [Bradyrhizobium sp. UASWS1016]